VTHFSGQLGEAQDQEKIRVAGLVTTVRPYVTKTGKPMGFATIEDIQGNIELVLFPRTWEKTREQLIVGQIIIAEGKVDTSNTPPKVLVEAIRTEFKMTVSADEAPSETPALSPLPMPAVGTVFAQKSAEPVGATEPGKSAISGSGKIKAAEPTSSYSAGFRIELETDDWDSQSMPPPPDNFPANWESEWQPSFENAALAARAEPKPDEKTATTSAVTTPTESAEAQSVTTQPKPAPTRPIETAREAVLRHPTEAKPLPPLMEPVEQEAPALPSLYVPLAQAEKDQDHPPKQITVMLRSLGDKDRDKLRIRTLYGTLISFHGRDRFSFQIFESGKGHLIDFPNDSTRICPEMLTRLQKLVGEESWRVEEIQ
jgi:DNA polymerase-3 subunit alpha